MKIFNRYTEGEHIGAILTFDRAKERACHCRFNVRASRMMELSKDEYLQFVNMDGMWLMCKTPHKKGYKIIPAGEAFRISCKSFIDYFLDELKYKEVVVHCKVRLTKHELEGYPMFEIYTPKARR